MTMNSIHAKPDDYSNDKIDNVNVKAQAVSDKRKGGIPRFNKKTSAILFASMVTIVAVLGAIAAHTNYNKEYELSYLTFALTHPQYKGKPFEYALVQMDASNDGVVDMLTGEMVEEVRFHSYADGRIIKVTPTQLMTVRGTLFWRFFKCGMSGDRYTKFQKLLPEDVPLYILGFSLDLTNPTPFSLFVLLFLVSYIGFFKYTKIRSRIKHVNFKE